MILLTILSFGVILCLKLTSNDVKSGDEMNMTTDMWVNEQRIRDNKLYTLEFSVSAAVVKLTDKEYAEIIAFLNRFDGFTLKYVRDVIIYADKETQYKKQHGDKAKKKETTV